MSPKSLEIYDKPFLYTYGFHIYWDPRAETPDEIANRLRRFLDGLSAINPVFAKWRVGARHGRLYEKVRDDLASIIKSDINRDDLGKPFPIEGYRLIGVTYGQPSSRSFGFHGDVGSTVPRDLTNYIVFDSDLYAPIDAELLTYCLFRSIVLLIVACWEPRVVSSLPHGLHAHRSQMGPYQEAWISYIPPDLAHTIQVGVAPVVEKTPNGGLLLVATTETFKMSDPVHLDGARKVALAARHLHTGSDAEPFPRRQGWKVRDH